MAVQDATMTRQGGSGKGFLIVILLVGMVGLGLYLASTSKPAPKHKLVEIDGIIVQVDDNHADKAHGAEEAWTVRNGCAKNGTYQVYRELKYKNVFHRICKLDDGRFGDWIVSIENGIKYEDSAFVPKDGTWGRVVDWLLNKATRFTAPIFSH